MLHLLVLSHRYCFLSSRCSTEDPPPPPPPMTSQWLRPSLFEVQKNFAKVTPVSFSDQSCQTDRRVATRSILSVRLSLRTRKEPDVGNVKTSQSHSEFSDSVFARAVATEHILLDTFVGSSMPPRPWTKNGQRSMPAGGSFIFVNDSPTPAKNDFLLTFFAHHRRNPTWFSTSVEFCMILDAIEILSCTKRIEIRYVCVEDDGSDRGQGAQRSFTSSEQRARRVQAPT